MLELVMLLLLLPSISSKADTTKCHMKDPLPVPHEWYQPGDFLIGEMASHLFYLMDEIAFSRHPAQDLYRDP